MSPRVTRDSWTRERVLDDLERLALRAPSRAEFFDEAALRLQRVVPFDGACWHTLDPGSGLITQHRLQNLADRFPAIADNEYRVDDVNRFRDLARAARPAATLAGATGGRPERSARFRELLAPAGIGPELRGAFVADGVAWGAVILVRQTGRDEFDDDDVALVAAASSLLARAVRRGLVTEACTTLGAADPPGLVELDGEGRLLRASGAAPALLAELSGTTAEDGVGCAAVQAVASATRAAGDAAAGLPVSTVKTPAGSWLVLHGARIGGGAVGVFIQRAHPTLVAPVLLKAHGLTPREQQVAQLVLRGASTAQIAQRLRISPHTVNEHLKSIYDKTGARTRGELTAKLFFGEHLPRIVSGVGVGDDASFVDAPRPRGKP